MKCSLVLAAAMAAAILFYYASNQVVTHLLDTYFQVSVYIERATDKTAERLQKYISDNNLASDDIEGLNKWSRKHILVYYTVLRNGEMTYTSYYADDTADAADLAAVDMTETADIVDVSDISDAAHIADADAADLAADIVPGGESLSGEGDAWSDSGEEAYMTEAMYGNEAKQYNMDFADGQAEVYLVGLFEYQFYLIAHYIELTLSALIFLLIFLLFLQKKLKYVRQLENEVKILEGGGMDKEITVKGTDELSELAFGLNQMRLSLDENMKEKEELLQANNSLVTGMAHDLRTPLTSLLLYTELLSKKKYKDEREMEQYLEKTSLKANQIKRMSDQLFEQFYIMREEKVPLEPPHSLRSVLEGRLSDLVMFLESQGFTVTCSISWPEAHVSVVSEYMDRILDNIASNIQKYADTSQPVEIAVNLSASMEEAPMEEAPMEESCITLKIGNKIKTFCGDVESTNLGVLNIRHMMKKMNGKCIMQENGDTYEISLLLPAAEPKRRLPV